MRSVPEPLGAIRHLIFSSLLVAMVLTSFSVSLPQRGFVQGQPELQQSMDNMVSGRYPVKKSHYISSGEEKGYPALLTHKVSDLLYEAEQMLNRVKNVKERRWVEAFMVRFKALAASLDGNSAQYNTEYTTTKSVELKPSTNIEDSSPYTTQPTSKELKGGIVKNSIYVEINNDPKQGIRRTPQDDELVRELESLHSLKRSPAFNAKQNEITKPEPKKSYALSQDKYSFNEAKLRIEEKLQQDINELRRFGETDEELMKLLPVHDNFQFSGPPVQHDLSADDKKEIRIELNTEKLKEHLQKSKNLMMSVNPHFWSPSHISPASSDPSKGIYINKTLGGNNMHPPYNPHIQPPLSQNGYMYNGRLRHHGLQGAIQKLQGQGYPNYMRHQQFYEGQNLPINNEQKTAPGMEGQQNKQFMEQAQNRNSYIYKPFYNSAGMNETFGRNIPYYPPMSSDFKPDFTEEMKRELRDGKVIILSDNVVHSNFTAENENKDPKIGKSKEG